MNKQYRIKKSDEIEAVMKRGAKFSSKYFVIYKLENHETNHFRFATSVGKKIGNAVNRNLVKRRIRAAIDKFDLSLKEMDVFIVAKPNVNDLTFDEYVKQISYLLKKLHIID
jgi:ribonuclease P protein component